MKSIKLTKNKIKNTKFVLTRNNTEENLKKD
jgi:hypothetical protein